jgi:hypothetical protein
MQSTDDTHEYDCFINKKVVDQEDGIWTTGLVLCFYQDILSSMTHMLIDNILSPKNQMNLTYSIWLSRQLIFDGLFTFFPSFFPPQLRNPLPSGLIE